MPPHYPIRLEGAYYVTYYVNKWLGAAGIVIHTTIYERQKSTGIMLSLIISTI